eukprot:TRINITY_DN21270_c0_g1_i1.p1 TRINITY_DN21270_c0_g1~~TRINITY_DN21270_c0_g1_i1.p1  ORF type:complete len:281 (-),score=77.17 TRINITY_DN21270_c0_g1_i1:29-841(-)
MSDISENASPTEMFKEILRLKQENSKIEEDLRRAKKQLDIQSSCSSSTGNILREKLGEHSKGGSSVDRLLSIINKHQNSIDQSVKETGDFLSNTRAEFASKQDEDRENSQEQEKAEEKESVTKDEDADNKEKDDAEEDNKAEENEEVPVEREEESSPVEPLEPNTDENEEQAVTISEPQTPKVKSVAPAPSTPSTPSYKDVAPRVYTPTDRFAPKDRHDFVKRTPGNMNQATLLRRETAKRHRDEIEKKMESERRLNRGEFCSTPKKQKA